MVRGGEYSRTTQQIAVSPVPVGRLLHAQELLESREGSPEELFMSVPQASFQADHYALAWSFLHYRLERPGDDNVKQFARFLRETSGSGSRPLGGLRARHRRGPRGSWPGAGAHTSSRSSRPRTRPSG